jgi:ABC-type transporter Mla MlaB component
MTYSFQQSGDTGVLAVSGALTIEDAAELKSVIADALAASTGLMLDMAEVETADLSCLQLLCSAHRSAAHAGKGLELRNAGDGFISGMRAAGYGRHLGCQHPSRSDCLWLEPENMLEDNKRGAAWG